MLPRTTSLVGAAELPHPIRLITTLQRVYQLSGDVTALVGDGLGDGGEVKDSAKGWSSKPITDTSSGTLSPSRDTVLIAPNAISSDSAKMAVGGRRRVKSSAAARCPPAAGEVPLHFEAWVERDTAHLKCGAVTGPPIARHREHGAVFGVP